MGWMRTRISAQDKHGRPPLLHLDSNFSAHIERLVSVVFPKNRKIEMSPTVSEFDDDQWQEVAHSKPVVPVGGILRNLESMTQGPGLSLLPSDDRLTYHTHETPRPDARQSQSHQQDEASLPHTHHPWPSRPAHFHEMPQYSTVASPYALGFPLRSHQSLHANVPGSGNPCPANG